MPKPSSEPPLAPIADDSTSPRTLPDVTHLFAQQRPQNTREQRVGETQETRGTACFQIPLLPHAFHHRLSCGHDIVTTQPEACGINCLEYFTKCMGKKFECPHRQCKQKRAEHNKMFIKKLVIGRKCVLSKAFDGNSGASAVRAKEKDDAIASQLESTHVGRFATTAPNTFDEDPAMQRAKQQLAANMQTAENAKPKTILHSGVMEPSAVQLEQERCDAAEEDEGQGVRLPGLWMFEQERRNAAKGQAMRLPGLGMLNIQAQEKGMQVSQEGEGEGQDTGTEGAETQMAMPQQVRKRASEARWDIQYTRRRDANPLRLSRAKKQCRRLMRLRKLQKPSRMMKRRLGRTLMRSGRSSISTRGRRRWPRGRARRRRGQRWKARPKFIRTKALVTVEWSLAFIMGASELRLRYH